MLVIENEIGISQMVQIVTSQQNLTDRIRSAAQTAAAKKGWLTFKLVTGKKISTEGPIDLSDDSMTFLDHDGAEHIIPLLGVASVLIEE